MPLCSISIISGVKLFSRVPKTMREFSVVVAVNSLMVACCSELATVPAIAGIISRKMRMSWDSIGLPCIVQSIVRIGIVCRRMSVVQASCHLEKCCFGTDDPASLTLFFI